MPAEVAPRSIRLRPTVAEKKATSRLYFAPCIYMYAYNSLPMKCCKNNEKKSITAIVDHLQSFFLKKKLAYLIEIHKHATEFPRIKFYSCA